MKTCKSGRHQYEAGRDRCPECRREYFRAWQNKHKDKVQSWNKAWESPAKSRARQMRHRYGLSLQEANALCDKGCQICGKKSTGKRSLHIDHDHRSGKVRGVLCAGCNTAIGKLGDSVEGLKAAIRYLEGSTW